MEQRLEFLLVQNIHALETARWILDSALQKLRGTNERKELPSKPRAAIYKALRKSALLNLLLAAVLLLMAIGVNMLGSKIEKRGFFNFLIEQFFPLLLCVAGLAFLAFGAYRYWVSVVKRRNAEEELRQQKKQQMRQRQQENLRQRRLEFYEAEAREVARLLEMCYRYCDIPVIYRTPEYVSHIYGYMREHRAALEQAVMHEQFTGGIDEAAEAFAQTVAQTKQELFGNRIQLANNSAVERYIYQTQADPNVADCYRQSGNYFLKATYLLK